MLTYLSTVEYMDYCVHPCACSCKLLLSSSHLFTSLSQNATFHSLIRCRCNGCDDVGDMCSNHSWQILIFMVCHCKGGGVLQPPTYELRRCTSQWNAERAMTYLMHYALLAFSNSSTRCVLTFSTVHGLLCLSMARCTHAYTIEQTVRKHTNTTWAWHEGRKMPQEKAERKAVFSIHSILLNEFALPEHTEIPTSTPTSSQMKSNLPDRRWSDTNADVAGW